MKVVTTSPTVERAVFPAGTPESATDFLGLNSLIPRAAHFETYPRLIHIHDN